MSDFMDWLTGLGGQKFGGNKLGGNTFGGQTFGGLKTGSAQDLPGAVVNATDAAPDPNPVDPPLTPATPYGGNTFGGNTFGGNKFGGATYGGSTFGGNKFGASAPLSAPDPNALPSIPGIMHDIRNAPAPQPSLAGALAGPGAGVPQAPDVNGPVLMPQQAPSAPAPAVPPQGDNLPPLPPQQVAANAPAATADPTPLTPAPDAGPAAPSDTPAGRSLLDRIMGSSDASTKDAHGLTEMDRHQAGFEGLAKLGFGIMAASMPQAPGQRAQAIQQLGNIPAGMLKQQAAQIGMQAQAQQVKLRQQQLDAKKASLDYMKSPEFQETLKNLPPQMQGVMKAAAAAGDLGAIAHIQQGMLPKMVGNTIFNPATGQYSNTLTGASGGPGGTPGAAAPGGTPAAPSDGLPPPAPPTPGYAPLADAKPVTPGLRPEALSAFSPEIAGPAKAVGEGMKAIPSLVDRNGIGLQIYKAAKLYNPNLDEATYATRLDQKKHLNNEFFGSGRTAKNITALDTAYGHIGMLSDLTKDLNGNSPQLVNQALAKLNTAFGGTKYTQADVASGAVAHEMAKVFRDTGMSNEDAQEWARRLDVGKSSGPQMAATLNTALGLMEERKRALETQYKRGGGEGNTDWFTPEHTAKSQQIKGDFTRQQFGLAPSANVTDFEYSRDANGQIVRKPKKH